MGPIELGFKFKEPFSIKITIFIFSSQVLAQSPEKTSFTSILKWLRPIPFQVSLSF